MLKCSDLVFCLSIGFILFKFSDAFECFSNENNTNKWEIVNCDSVKQCYFGYTVIIDLIQPT